MYCTHDWLKHAGVHCIYKLISIYLCAYIGTITVYIMISCVSILCLILKGGEKMQFLLSCLAKRNISCAVKVRLSGNLFSNKFPPTTHISIKSVVIYTSTFDTADL